jgi:predicted chitinase
MAFVHLLALTDTKPLSSLDQPTLTELQIGLARLGYPIGGIDGQFGPRTRSAWAEFKTDVFSGNVDLVGPDSIATLVNKVQQLETIEGSNQSTKADVIDAIKAECQALEIGLKTQIAYVLATTQWETAQTFKPVREAFWNDEQWRKNNLRYYPYYGRGYVQLTWRNNYQAYSDILSQDLVNNPDLALNTNVALFVLVQGFKTGAFTGRKITDFINSGQTDFVGARRCINGTDKANEIAALAQSFMSSV